MARESLLGQAGGVPEGSSGTSDGDAPAGDAGQEHHPDPSWRADALGKSRHARLSDHIQEPLDDRDSDKARRICAEVARNLLGDLAPALVLVPSSERFRCQVLATWVQTLFDFARQSGVEGERLAALNRLEFSLEQSLEAELVGQPVFVGMALEESRRAWPREALDVLMRAARRRVVQPRLETPAEVEADATELAAALVMALSSAEPDPTLASQGGALLRLFAVLGLGEAMRRDQAALPQSELPSRGDLRETLDRARLDTAVRLELARLRPILEELPAATPGRGLAAAGRYLRLAGLELLDRAEQLGWQVVDEPPQLGAAPRVGLLLRSRLSRR